MLGDWARLEGVNSLRQYKTDCIMNYYTYLHGFYRLLRNNFLYDVAFQGGGGIPNSNSDTCKVKTQVQSE